MFFMYPGEMIIIAYCVMCTAIKIDELLNDTHNELYNGEPQQSSIRT